MAPVVPNPAAAANVAGNVRAPRSVELKAARHGRRIRAVPPVRGSLLPVLPLLLLAAESPNALASRPRSREAPGTRLSVPGEWTLQGGRPAQVGDAGDPDTGSDSMPGFGVAPPDHVQAPTVAAVTGGSMAEVMSTNESLRPAGPLPGDEGVAPSLGDGVSVKALKWAREAMVRIKSFEDRDNMWRPWQEGSESAAIGSGFSVVMNEGQLDQIPSDLNAPIFVTNAHVVNNARKVQIQLPTVGQKHFDAFVPMIYEAFDLALVQPIDAKTFVEYARSQGAEFRPLPIKEDKDVPVHMGLKVYTLGFPLGTSSEKCSDGAIAGIEQVDNRLCYQSTAPISPGNSGGPLFAMRNMNGSAPVAPGANEQPPLVIGVNFAGASAMFAQNANYAVPLIHIRQLLRQYGHCFQELGEIGAECRSLSLSRGGADKQGEASAITAPHPHIPVRIAPIGIVHIEANDALQAATGCNSGVFISKIHPKSALRRARTVQELAGAGMAGGERFEEVPEHTFLVSVNGIPLDAFGMARSTQYLQQPLKFEYFMRLQERVDDELRLEICENGKYSSYLVSMAWSDEYENGILEVDEPAYYDMKYETFAGVTVMPMTQNHVNELLREGGPETLGRWLLPDSITNKRLMVVHVESATYASRVLARGMVVMSVNGYNVTSLDEYKDHFVPESGAKIWELETERGFIYDVDFADALAAQADRIRNGESRLKTNAVMMALPKTESQEGPPGSDSSAVPIVAVDRTRGNVPAIPVVNGVGKVGGNLLKVQFGVVLQVIGDALRHYLRHISGSTTKPGPQQGQLDVPDGLPSLATRANPVVAAPSHPGHVSGLGSGQGSPSTSASKPIEPNPLEEVRVPSAGTSNADAASKGFAAAPTASLAKDSASSSSTLGSGTRQVLPTNPFDVTSGAAINQPVNAEPGASGGLAEPLQPAVVSSSVAAEDASSGREAIDDGRHHPALAPRSAEQLQQLPQSSISTEHVDMDLRSISAGGYAADHPVDTKMETSSGSAQPSQGQPSPSATLTKGAAADPHILASNDAAAEGADTGSEGIADGDSYPALAPQSAAHPQQLSQTIGSTATLQDMGETRAAASGLAGHGVGEDSRDSGPRSSEEPDQFAEKLAAEMADLEAAFARVRALGAMRPLADEKVIAAKGPQSVDSPGPTGSGGSVEDHADLVRVDENGRIIRARQWHSDSATRQKPDEG